MSLNYYRGVFKRLLLATGAKEPQVTLRTTEPGEAAYEMQWQG